MPNAALDGAACEADGHPTDCQEPASGSVTASGSIWRVEGTPVGTQDGTMEFPSHSHDHSVEEGCHDDQSHSLTPDDSHILREEGQPLMFVGDSTDDPGSGGTAEIVGDGGNSILRES